MNQNDQFGQNTPLEIREEELHNVAGGANFVNVGVSCKYCGRNDSFVYARFANGDGTSYLYCTACKHVYY